MNHAPRKVPLFDIREQHQAVEAELMSAFQRVLRSGQFILGSEVLEFERQIAQFLGTRHAIGVSSGTDAILLALMARQIGPGDEVLCPSFTFFATAGCIARVGATPVFVDSCPVCFNMNSRDAERKISPRTKAVVPVHLFGQAADMDPILALAAQHGLTVIEDAAQALGAEYRGRKVGTIGTAGAFSFFPTKNLGALGDAGLLVTNNDELGERAQLLRNHGARQRYHHDMVGGNFRLDALQAALLAVKLPHYQTYTEKRQHNAEYYAKRLGALAGVEGPNRAESQCEAARSEPTAKTEGPVRLVLPGTHPHNAHIWNQYTVRVPGHEQRDALRNHLAQDGIGSEVYYPVPLHRQACFGTQQLGAGKMTPGADRLARECLSLPIYPELTRDQLDQVVESVARFVRGLVPS